MTFVGPSQLRMSYDSPPSICWKTTDRTFGHLNTITVSVEHEVFAVAKYDCYWQTCSGMTAMYHLFNYKSLWKTWEKRVTPAPNPDWFAEGKEVAESVSDVIILQRMNTRQCDRPSNIPGFQAKCGEQRIMEAQAFLQQMQNNKFLIWMSDLMLTGDKAQLCSSETVWPHRRGREQYFCSVGHFEEGGEHAPPVVTLPTSWHLCKQCTNSQVERCNNFTG